MSEVTRSNYKDLLPPEGDLNDPYPVTEAVATDEDLSDEEALAMADDDLTPEDLAEAEEEPLETSETLEVKADAKNRAVRTFLQGLVFDIVVALIVFLTPVVTSASTLADIQVEVVLFSASKTVILALFAYLMRYFGLAPGTAKAA